MPFTIPTFLAINYISRINLFQRVKLLGLSYKGKIIGFSSLFVLPRFKSLVLKRRHQRMSEWVSDCMSDCVSARHKQ